MSETKYISFDPWWGGYSNIRMTYEIAAAISVITGRKLIIPPKIYCLFLSEWEDKNTWFDMFSTLDKDLFYKNFDCVDYYDVPEYISLENETQYFENVSSIAKVITFGEQDDKFGPMNAPDRDYFLYCGIEDQNDYNSFAQGRTGINLDVEDKFIHFPRNLFGHYYYHVYGKNISTRNKVTHKVNVGIQYKKKYFYIAKQIVDELGGQFDALHIRRNDFLQTRKSHSEAQTENLLTDIVNRIRTDVPIYVATDEKNKDVFADLQKEYDIRFLNDFNLGLESHEALMVDQIVCSMGETFLGSFLSTFSDYINILRGQSGKKDMHREGTNFNRGVLNYDTFPWLEESWSWDKTWDYHWKYEKEGFNIGIYGSHNASLCISKEGDVLEAVEVERWADHKNAAFCCHFPLENPAKVLAEIIDYFRDKYGAYRYDNCINNSCPPELKLLDEIPADNYVWMSHHKAHAYNALYQKDFDKSLIVTFDGGSDEGHFNIWLAEGKEITKIHTTTQDICVPYAAVGHYLSPIKKEFNWWWGNLIYAGKVMGLSGYGKFDQDVFEKMHSYYKLQQSDCANKAHENFQKIFDLNGESRLSEELSKDFAYVNQYTFESVFREVVMPYVSKYPDHQLIFAGGGAMNIINNTIWDAYVTPNPDDRGLSFGLLAGAIKPKTIDTAYLGSYPFDEIGPTEDISMDELVQSLDDGKIIGMIHGRSEYGARALGRRSIICMPREGMKDKLNDQVKHREYFRPFAPICRDVDVDDYFTSVPSNLKYMTHNAMCSDKDLASVIHEDGTSRLQIVSEDSEPFVYSLLTAMKEKGLKPVILNTSFNVMGKPIINRYSDARVMLNNGELDMVISKFKKLI